MTRRHGKRTSPNRPQPPPAGLLPELLDQIIIQVHLRAIFVSLLFFDSSGSS